jgi:hypothetical protein
VKIVRIKHFSVEGKKYRVAIGNGITREFVNRKLCMKFLADANRFLTMKLHECNFLLSDLQVQFRRNWFYFDNNRSAGADLYAMERNCLQNMRAIEDKMDLLVNRASFENGNQFVFAHFRTIFILMMDTMKVLQQLQAKKSSAVEVHKMEVLYIRVRQIEKELFEYDGTFTKEQLDADEIFTRNRMKAI